MMHPDDLYVTIRDRQREMREEAAGAPQAEAEYVLTLPAIALAWQLAELLDRAS
jgi:hypothetical protein